MSDEHKAALAEGRARGRAVKNYLEALEQARPKRGRKRTPDSIRGRIDKLNAELPDQPILKRLDWTQEIRNLEAELEILESESGPDLEALEADFVAVAREYGDGKRIGYSTWRDFGVPAAALKAAGITRST